MSEIRRPRGHYVAPPAGGSRPKFPGAGPSNPPQQNQPKENCLGHGHIISFKDGLSPKAIEDFYNDLNKKHGITPKEKFEYALSGFAADMSPEKHRELERDGKIKYVDDVKPVYPARRRR